MWIGEGCQLWIEIGKKTVHRWIFFFLFILLGLAMGLLYGLYLNPIRYTDISLEVLAPDYKTDYVLMVAETYHQDGALALAVERLSELGADQPAEIVRQALNFAEKAGYNDADLHRIWSMLASVETSFPTPGAASP